MIERCPTFQFWDLILLLERLILVFVKVEREDNFQLYVEALETLAPWFFALDHVNYSHWLPVHIRDMESLGAYHLHGETGNSGWKIKRFASFRLEKFRNFGLLVGVMHTFYSF